MLWSGLITRSSLLVAINKGSLFTVIARLFRKTDLEHIPMVLLEIFHAR